MQGTFRLYYRDVSVEIPCVGVTYQITKSSGLVVASGQTDNRGETKAFNGLFDDDIYELKVRADAGNWSAPKTITGADSSPEIELPGPATKGAKLQKVRLSPFYKVRFIQHPDRKPIADAKYTAYALNSDGKEAIARDANGKTITGKTNGDGETPEIFCSSALVFKFEVPGTPVKVPTRKLQPLFPGQQWSIYEHVFKSVKVMTAPSATNQANISGKTSLPAIISPQDDELILVGQSDFEDFEEVTGQLDKIIAAMHGAKLDLSRALESGHQSTIEAAEKALAGAEDKVKTELNKNFSKSADLKEVVTLETRNAGKNSAGGQTIGLRRRYIKTDKYMQLRNSRINQKEYKLNVKFAAGATKGSGEIQPKSLNVAALKDSFKTITQSLKLSPKWEADPKTFNLLELAGNEYSDTIVQSETYQVEAQAQWLRLVGCAGANADIDWKGKKAQIQGNLQGKLVLCEGKITGQWAAPSLKGWMMELAGEDLGAIRFLIEVSLYGFAGAKVVASGAVGITLEQGKQVAKAIKNEPKESFAKLIDPKANLPKFDARAPYDSANDLNGVKFELDAFAGVEAGITPAGKIQWLPPQEKDFVSFAEVSATIAGNAGAGLSASLAVYYFGGKFRVRAAARLCWGLGAKGALEFTVDASKIGEFVKWLHYQLLHAGFRKMLNIEQLAFRRLSQLLILLINEGYLPVDAKNIQRAADDIDTAFQKLNASLEIAQQRNALVNNINRSPHWLVHATPETRGMLLYQITRHGMPSHARNLPEIGGSLVNPEVHYLPNHKKAVCTIIKTIQTAAEWDNVMQHMTAEGIKSSRASGQNEGDVVRFLNNGLSLAEDLPSIFDAMNRMVPPPAGQPTNDKSDKPSSGNSHLDDYLKCRGKLMDKFPKGYKVAVLDTPAFDMLAAMDGNYHPQFAEIQTACIGEAYSGDPGSSLA